MSPTAVETAQRGAQRLLATIQANSVIFGLAAAAILGAAWIIYDYKEWRALGTGGTSSDVYGYCRMTLYRIIFAYHVPRQTNPQTLSNDGPSFLKDVPVRAGGRPRLMPRTLPQRQRPEPIEPSTKVELMSLMHRMASQRPDILESRPSHTEGRTADGLYVRKNYDKVNPIVAAHRDLKYEIGHAHPADCSLHIFLSEADARKIIEARWGQRFCLPHAHFRGWTMVYAPRNEAELALVEEFVKASVRWATGVPI